MSHLVAALFVASMVVSSAHAQLPRIGWETACGLLVADGPMVAAHTLTNKAPNCCWVPRGTPASDVVEMCINKTGGATYPIP